MINAQKADKIISGILEFPNESRAVEFKPSFAWPSKIDGLQNNDKAQEVIESILAMSNIRYGGKIILGVEKDSSSQKYSLKGMRPEDLNTYDQDSIFEHVRNFGKPEPKFQVLNIEYDSKNFIVFAVQSFVFAPIICRNRKKLRKLDHAVFYIRTDKPETKKITEPWEMREIVDLAIEKELNLFSTRMERFFKTMSTAKVLKTTKDDYEKFKDELKDVQKLCMNKEDVIKIKKIKSKGYWEINIHPDVYNSQRIEKQRIKEIVRSSVVELRGWDYPHFRDSEGPYSILNGIEKFIDWSNHIEFWRMTQSANFYHLLSLREDWIKDVEYRNMWSKGDELKGKKWLGVLSTLYTLTEIFEFAKRLSHQNIFDENVIIEIKLYDLVDRILVIDSPNKFPFSFERKAKISEPWTYHKNFFSVNEVLNQSDEIALNAFVDLVYLFEWDNPPIESLKNDQQKFLQGRI